MLVAKLSQQLYWGRNASAHTHASYYYCMSYRDRCGAGLAVGTKKDIESEAETWIHTYIIVQMFHRVLGLLVA